MTNWSYLLKAKCIDNQLHFNRKERFVSLICPICCWEEYLFGFRDPFDFDVANRVSLIQANVNYKFYGACKLDKKGIVREPLKNEVQKQTFAQYDE